MNLTNFYMKSVIVTMSFLLLLTSCGLKKPLETPHAKLSNFKYSQLI